MGAKSSTAKNRGVGNASVRQQDNTRPLQAIETTRTQPDEDKHKYDHALQAPISLYQPMHDARFGNRSLDCSTESSFDIARPINQEENQLDPLDSVAAYKAATAARGFFKTAISSAVTAVKVTKAFVRFSKATDDKYQISKRTTETVIVVGQNSVAAANGLFLHANQLLREPEREVVVVTEGYFSQWWPWAAAEREVVVAESCFSRWWRWAAEREVVVAEGYCSNFSCCLNQATDANDVSP